MKRLFIAIACMFASASAYADTIDDCSVSRVESGKSHSIFFVEDCKRLSSDAVGIPQGNAYTNDLVGEYFYLARSSADIEATKHMFSMILAAYTANKRIVVRWTIEENVAVAHYVLVK